MTSLRTKLAFCKARGQWIAVGTAGSASADLANVFTKATLPGSSRQETEINQPDRGAAELLNAETIDGPSKSGNAFHQRITAAGCRSYPIKRKEESRRSHEVGPLAR
jgi:hypothetical protein